MIQRMLVQQYEALTFQDRGFTDFWFDGGVGSGKTHIAPRWLERQMEEQPTWAIGFIGANDYDQLNMATLPPLLNYMGEKGVDHVMHKRPPASWKGGFPRELPHKNILSFSTGHQFICKPMKAKGFNIPGVQIWGWWIDEVGDCPLEAMQKIRERRRQPGTNHCGLVTGTPGGPDHFTFKDYMNPGTRLPRHGFTVAKTIEAVEAGYISMDYFQLLKKTYSKRKGAARLDGEVVDSEQLRAYESHSSEAYPAGNACLVNPFNDFKPGMNPKMPIGIFCDFNAVKKCIWVLGQYDHQRTHVEDEVALETTRVQVMMGEVFRKYGRWQAGFHFYGDASGTRDELTSGSSCFEVLRGICHIEKVRASFYTKKANPTRSDRIEAMNTSLCSYDNFRALTYNPHKAPELHLDFLRVGWDGVKLMDNGDPDRTHAGDGLGYHVEYVRPVRGPSYAPISGHGSESRRD